MLKKIQEQNISTPIMSVTTSIARVIADEKVDVSKISKLYVISPESSKEFEDKFRDFYKVAPGAYADRAYDTLMLLVDAIQNKGAMELKDYLRNETNYKGFLGQYNFDENGDIQGGNWIVRTTK
jgi:ABC-type branched-subunit amino acid transport system substrate-binding protein